MMRRWQVVMVFSVMVAVAMMFSGLGTVHAADKIASLDMGKAFNAYEKTREADAILEKKSKEKAAERDRMVEEIKRLQDELELMSQKGREEKKRLIEEKSRAFRNFERDTREELMRERDRMAKDILEEIRDEASKYGKENGYTFIIESGALVYSISNVDVTDKIIEIINAKYKKWKK